MTLFYSTPDTSISQFKENLSSLVALNIFDGKCYKMLGRTLPLYKICVAELTHLDGNILNHVLIHQKLSEKK